MMFFIITATSLH